jgi:DNA-binding transcriptional ArsR family regulator
MSTLCSSKMNLVDTFRAFSDPSRLRILHLLLQQPLCVCHLQELLDQPQVNVSQHLAYLRKAGLVEFTRVQTWKVYRLRSPRSRAVELSLRCLAESAKSDPTLTSDLKRLPRALKNSRFSSCGDLTAHPSTNSSKQGSSIGMKGKTI